LLLMNDLFGNVLCFLRNQIGGRMWSNCFDGMADLRLLAWVLDCTIVELFCPLMVCSSIISYFGSCLDEDASCVILGYSFCLLPLCHGCICMHL